MRKNRLNSHPEGISHFCHPEGRGAAAQDLIGVTVKQ
jgi:hypothetical protein